MAKRNLSPHTTLRRYQHGSGWYIQAVGDNGVPENIGDGSARPDHSQICRLFQRADAMAFSPDVCWDLGRPTQTWTEQDDR